MKETRYEVLIFENGRSGRSLGVYDTKQEAEAIGTNRLQANLINNSNISSDEFLCNFEIIPIEIETEEPTHYTKANNKNEETVLQEQISTELLDVLEKAKDKAYKNKAHKTFMDSLQECINILVLKEYQARRINNRSKQEHHE